MSSPYSAKYYKTSQKIPSTASENSQKFSKNQIFFSVSKVTLKSLKIFFFPFTNRNVLIYFVYKPTPYPPFSSSNSIKNSNYFFNKNEKKM